MSQNGRALISALNQGDFDAVERIHLSDSDLKIFNHHVHELFERAIAGGNLPLFRALLDVPRIRISGPDYCAIRHATQLGQVEYLRELEGQRNVKPSLRDKMGKTALHHALLGKWNETKGLALVEVLVTFPGIKTNSRDAERKTPLHYAIERNWFKVADILLDHKASPSIEDGNEQTPLSIAMEKFLDIPSELLDRLMNAPPYMDEEEEEEPDDPYLGKTEEEIEQARFNQMNAHKTWDIKAPDTLVDRTDPAPLSQSSPIKEKPVTYDDVRAVDPLAVQQAKLPTTHTPTPTTPTPEPIKAEPRNAHPNPPQEKPRTFAKEREPLVLDESKTFLDIMGVNSEDELPELISRDYLLSPSDDNARWRLHRAPVIEKLETLNEILVRKGQGLQPEDFRLSHPSTGSNLWHVAAAVGQFETAFRVLDQQRMWPRPEDFRLETEVGKTITDVLEDTNRLSGVLHSDIWNAHPQLLAALLASLPSERRQQFASLVTKTNLLILHG